MTAESPDTARAGSSDASLLSDHDVPRAVEHHDAGALGMNLGDVVAALLDARLALSYCGKAAVGRALNAQALRKIKAVLDEVDRQWKADLGSRARRRDEFPFTADELLGCLSRWRGYIPKAVASTLELIEQWRRQS